MTTNGVALKNTNLVVQNVSPGTGLTRLRSAQRWGAGVLGLGALLVQAQRSCQRSFRPTMSHTARSTFKPVSELDASDAWNLSSFVLKGLLWLHWTNLGKPGSAPTFKVSRLVTLMTPAKPLGHVRWHNRGSHTMGWRSQSSEFCHPYFWSCFTELEIGATVHRSLFSIISLLCYTFGLWLLIQ